MLANGFLLGLANGLSCLATCAAALLPLMLGEGGRVKDHGRRLALFMLGRLAGYLLFGVLAWAAGWLLLRDAAAQAILAGAAYLLLAGLMLAYGLGKSPACLVAPKALRARLAGLPGLAWLAPLIFGLLTGLNLCPPFLLAFTNAALNGTLGGSLLFFLAFFTGTSLYLLPLPLIGLVHNGAAAAQGARALQTIGKMAAVLMSFYYIVSGFLMIFEGVLA
jgi:sulfite exporter TauE/SafE